MTLKPIGAPGPESHWTKSSYSGADTPDCVEVAWTKSSYSSDYTGNCLEFATTPGTIHIRDSKHPAGPRLTLAPTTWARFLPYASAQETPC